MKRPLICCALVLALAGVGSSAWGQQRTLYLSPDVPTEPDIPDAFPDFLPWDVVEHVHTAAAPYALEFTVPGDPAVNALHKMDRKDHWLFSVEAPNDLGGALAMDAEPEDVIRVNLGLPLFTFFFDGSCVAPAVPTGCNVDAAYLDGGDGGDLIVSFEVPCTTVGGPTFLPSQLVRYTKTGPGACGWTLVGLEFDFATVGLYYPSSTRVTGADRAGGKWILALDIPVDLTPPLAPARSPGQIVATDGLTWDHFFDDLQTEGAPGWPVSSIVDALTCQANPGKIDSPTTQITLGKSGLSVSITCPGSCSSGAELYGVYEGTIASLFGGGVYDHKMKLCSEVCPGVILFGLVTAPDHYYLVVPHNRKEEGSYCIDSAGAERPQPAALADRCVATQTLTACP